MSIFILTATVLLSFVADHQKLEREARICRLLKHPNIGRNISLPSTVFIRLENLGEMEINKYKEQLREVKCKCLQARLFLYNVVLLTNSSVGCSILLDHLKQRAVFSSLSHCSAINELSVPGVWGFFEQCAVGFFPGLLMTFGDLQKNFSAQCLLHNEPDKCQ